MYFNCKLNIHSNHFYIYMCFINLSDMYYIIVGIVKTINILT